MTAATPEIVNHGAVDLNQPYILKNDIFMVKARPGVFTRKNGFQVTDAQAEEAGYKIDEERLEARIQAKEAGAVAAIQREAEVARAQIREEATAEIAAEDAESSKTSEAVTEPQITRNQQGEPRETPTHKIEFMRKTRDWVYVEKATKAIVESGLSKEEAIALLLAE